MIGGTSSRKIQKAILLFASGAFMASGIVIGLVSFWPLYNQMKANYEQRMMNAVLSKKLTIQEFLDRAKDSALQVTSRSVIREKLRQSFTFSRDAENHYGPHTSSGSTSLWHNSYNFLLRATVARTAKAYVFLLLRKPMTYYRICSELPINPGEVIWETGKMVAGKRSVNCTCGKQVRLGVGVKQYCSTMNVSRAPDRKIRTGEHIFSI
jgi:hypothetical protein